VPDLDEKVINQVTWKIPNGLFLIGARAGDTWNGMTASWVTQVSMEPVLIATSVENKALTKRLIDETGSFSINLWPAEDTKVFVKFSRPAEKEGMTLNGRPVREGKTGAPIFEEAVAWMEVEVRQSHDLGTHTLYVGELVDCGFNGDLEEGKERDVAWLGNTRMKYGGAARPAH
ncbi:MAG: flavin reductase family protein, partial [Actinomycetota bacterium]|nr:flavin reductase family protein [Actinomycetota bacterium]